MAGETAVEEPIEAEAGEIAVDADEAQTEDAAEVSELEPLVLTGLAASVELPFVGEPITFTYTAENAESVNWRIYNEAGDIAVGEAAEGAFAWTAEAAGNYTVAVTAWRSEEVLTVEMPFAVRPDYSGVVVRVTAYDDAEQPNVIGGWLEVELPRSVYDLAAAPVSFDADKYEYVNTVLGDTVLTGLAYSEADRAWSYTWLDAEGQTQAAQLTGDATLSVHFSEIFNKRVYEYEDGNIKAVVRLRHPSDVPDDADFQVKQVTPSGAAYNYDAYMDALNQQPVEQEYTAANTLLYDFAFMVQKTDETGLPTGEWYEYQPASGNIKIEVTFKQNQISEHLGAEEAADVSVVHLPLESDVLQAVDSTAEATQISAQNVNVENISEGRTDVDLEGTDTVVFTTPSLSVFAFTVDFHTASVDYSIPGYSQILLSGLIEKLHIIYGDSLLNVADVADVAFTDEHLVSVERVSGLITYNGKADVDVGAADYLLSSLAPFTSDETLTITLNDGAVIPVGVTDAQDDTTQTTTNLNSLLTGITITKEDGSSVSSGDTVTLSEYSKLNIKLQFTENDSAQFPDDDTEMKYAMPTGLELPDNFSGTFNVDIPGYGTVYRNTVSYDKGSHTLTVKWNTDDPTFDILTAADDAQFSFDISATVDSSATSVSFEDGTTININHEDPHEVTVDKSGTYDPATNKINYTLRIHSVGENNNVKVTDTIVGDALTFDRNVTGVDASYITSTVDNGFVVTYPSMGNNEWQEIHYSATVTGIKDIQSGNATVTQTGNTVKVSSDESPEVEKLQYVREINYSDIYKNALTVGKIDSTTKQQKVTWQIVTNSTPTATLAGSTITDRISSRTDLLSYTGDGIKIEVYDAAGTLVETRKPSWSQVGVNDTATVKQWTYNVPSDDGVYKYVITYDTVVDTTSL
ncbi:MAG: hypothetical protein IJ124_11025, partial [Clostridia bacterium]|nr:hypothetical protein [Clostridia bacterium]